MDENISKDLEQENPTAFHTQMLTDTRSLVSISRRKMTDYYPQWDRNDEVYRCVLQRDKADIAAKERAEPEKMIVPISYAQISTFVAFCYNLFTQRDRIFELQGFTTEDDRPAKVGEALIARDLAHNKFEVLLQQFLLDIARFGIGVFKTTWVTEKQMVRKTIQTPAFSLMGLSFGKGKPEETTEWATAYAGNKIVNISPYRFFPDVRLPFTRFQEGEFCASEDLYTMSQLKQMEAEGEVAGVDFIKPLGKDIAQDRGFRWDTGLDPGGALTQGAGIRGDGQTKKTIIVTEVQRTIIPSQYEVNGKSLGDDKRPSKWVIWTANDNRVIKCEPMNYLHNQFTYSLGQFVYDNNVLLSAGLSDVIDQLQQCISWFINSRITNVRKVIGDKLVVRPEFVNMTDLKERRPVIRLTASAPGDIDKSLKQLQLTDVTTSHITDVKVLHDMLKMVTGITDTLLGEVRPGKRSATENRNTTTGSAARLKTVAAALFAGSMLPMADQMLSNLRDGLDEEAYVKVLGMKGMTTPEFIKVDKSALVGHYAFETFDGTMPSERFHAAQALENFVAPFLANPQLAVLLGIDVKKIILEILYLRSIRNPERFEMRPEEQVQQNVIQQSLGGGGGGGSPQQPTAAGPGDPFARLQGAIPESLLPLLAGSSVSGGNPSNGTGVPRNGNERPF